jgi:hypothetical protein
MLFDRNIFEALFLRFQDTAARYLDASEFQQAARQFLSKCQELLGLTLGEHPGMCSKVKRTFRAEVSLGSRKEKRFT